MSVMSYPLHRHALPMYYILYANAYILGLQTRRSYLHIRRRFRQYLQRLYRRCRRVGYRIFAEPAVWVYHGIRQRQWHSLCRGLGRLTVLLSTGYLMVSAVWFYTQNTLAYAVTYRDRIIAYVAAPQTAVEGASRAEQLMQFYTAAESPHLSRAVVPLNILSDTVGISDAILACHSDTLQRASGLFLDGKYIGAVENRAALERLLEDLRTAGDTGKETKPSAFVQAVEVTDGAYPKGTLLSAENLRTILQSSKSEPVYYTVKSGDTLTSIARRHDLTLSALRERNPAFATSDLLHIGDKLLIKQASALLQVHTYRQISYKEAIPFETHVRPNDKHYVGEKYISRRGVNGEQEVVAEVEYTDGVETGRTILKTTVLKKPVTQRMQVGTRRGGPSGIYIAGDGKVTGDLTWPLPGVRTITSYYGRRWGTVHQGIDISGYGVYGKPIVAADGGVVYATNRTNSWGSGIFAGYGYAVILSHGNGMQTLYGHCSRVIVQPGQRVTKGQVIGYVGNTGYSTGPHLHFEVRVNNKRTNPLPYLQ